MKKKKIELEVDFIGNQPSHLTKDEEKAISDYIRSNKTKSKISKNKVPV